MINASIINVSSLYSFETDKTFKIYIQLSDMKPISFVKLAHPWHDLMINPPCRTFPKHLSLIYHENCL